MCPTGGGRSSSCNQYQTQMSAESNDLLNPAGLAGSTGQDGQHLRAPSIGAIGSSSSQISFYESSPNSRKRFKTV